jgi:hypothetical protein
MMTGVRRNLCLGLLWILGLGATDGAPVAAETDPPALAACKTTAGDDGLLFQDYHGMVHSPVEFETVRAEGSKLTFFPDMRDRLGSLAKAGPDAAPEAVVEFVAADGTTVHQCVVKIVAFDPEVNELQRLQAGDCNLKLVAGRAQLMAGHGQVVELPQDLADATIGPISVAYYSPIIDRSLYLLGKSPGMAVLVWMAPEAEGAGGVNLCPLTVADPVVVLGAGGPDDKDLCRDANDAPIRLSVGQTAKTEFRDTDGKDTEFIDYVPAAPRIADFSIDFGMTSGTVIGRAPRSTSITLFRRDGSVGLQCEVVVE